jgi:hypothetical protein
VEELLSSPDLGEADLTYRLVRVIVALVKDERNQILLRQRVGFLTEPWHRRGRYRV